ncbi:hypothetical protein ROZALSC1DRAFT_30314, partial [Rozella allomycis CSF55]
MFRRILNPIRRQSINCVPKRYFNAATDSQYDLFDIKPAVSKSKPARKYYFIKFMDQGRPKYLDPQPIIANISSMSPEADKIKEVDEIKELVRKLASNHGSGPSTQFILMQFKMYPEIHPEDTTSVLAALKDMVGFVPNVSNVVNAISGFNKRNFYEGNLVNLLRLTDMKNNEPKHRFYTKPDLMTLVYNEDGSLNIDKSSNGLLDPLQVTKKYGYDVDSILYNKRVQLLLTFKLAIDIFCPNFGLIYQINCQATNNEDCDRPIIISQRTSRYKFEMTSPLTLPMTAISNVVSFCNNNYEKLQSLNGENLFEECKKACQGYLDADSFAVQARLDKTRGYIVLMQNEILELKSKLKKILEKVKKFDFSSLGDEANKLDIMLDTYFKKAVESGDFNNQNKIADEMGFNDPQVPVGNHSPTPGKNDNGNSGNSNRPYPIVSI